MWQREILLYEDHNDDGAVDVSIRELRRDEIVITWTKLSKSLPRELR